MDTSTDLFIGIHRGESAMVAMLSTLSSNILDLFMRSISEVAGVGIMSHSGVV
jgi:hypothetical protein